MGGTDMKRIRPMWASLVVLALAMETGAFSAGADPQTGPSSAPRIVNNPKEPVLPPGQRKKIVFREELTIGQAEGDENYLFEKNIQCAADEKGAIYVVNWDRKRIQKYDAVGKYLLTIGRLGQGPGEFQNIWAPEFDGKGRIYATDIVAKRVQFFDKESGRYADAIKTGLQAGAVYLLPNGMYFSSIMGNPEEAAGGVTYSTVYGIFNKDFKLRTELHREKLQMRAPTDRSDRAKMLAGIMSDTAFKPVLYPVVTRDGRIIIAYPAAYEIKIFGDDGAAKLIIRKDDRPKPVTEAHKKFYFETSVMDFLAGSQNSMAVKDDVRKAMTYPKYLPAYRYCVPMDNGWYFVIEDSTLESSMIDLFDGQGVYIGRFETTIPVGQLVFVNGKAYAVADVEGYKYVKRFGYSVIEY
jgi:6-bladed beta-propeller